MKIALLGGAFNPLHIGHAMLAEIAAGELGFDKVLLVPTFIPPHKRFTDAASAKDRLGMVRSFCKDSPHFAAEACEIERGGVSYTFDTLEYIIKKFGDSIEGKPALIIGEENAREFEKWYRASDVASMSDIVIARRRDGENGEALKAFQNTHSGNYTGGFDGGVESVFFPFPHRLLDNPPLTLSSTEIRTRIGSGKSWRYLVPESVFRYIIRKRLYGYGRF